MARLNITGRDIIEVYRSGERVLPGRLPALQSTEVSAACGKFLLAGGEHDLIGKSDVRDSFG